MSRYGKDYKTKSEEIRSDHRYGIGSYEIKIHGKNERQIKEINKKKYENKNNSNKQQLDMIMLQHLQEKEKNGKLGESEDDDNMITEMEKMMSKENIGMNNNMKVPSIESVGNSAGKKGNENGGDKKDKNEKISIFERNEIENKIDNAKKAAKELEMLIDKRIEMKKNKGKKGPMKLNEEVDCSVLTSVNNEIKDNDNKNENENKNNKNQNRGGFNLGYTINRQCLIMDGKKLNIPKMRQSNPFEKLIRRQRVSDGNGDIVRYGSRNYDKMKIGEHETDSDSENGSCSESSDDDDDDIGDMNGIGEEQL